MTPAFFVRAVGGSSRIVLGARQLALSCDPIVLFERAANSHTDIRRRPQAAIV